METIVTYCDRCHKKLCEGDNIIDDGWVTAHVGLVAIDRLQLCEKCWLDFHYAVDNFLNTNKNNAEKKRGSKS